MSQPHSLQTGVEKGTCDAEFSFKQHLKMLASLVIHVWYAKKLLYYTDFILHGDFILQGDFIALIG